MSDVFIDGIKQVGPSQALLDLFVDEAGDTMTGFLTLSADPIDALHAVTKQYADQFLTVAEGDALFLTPAEGDALFLTPAEGDAAYVKKSGDTMTGFLTLHADPTSALHAATKQYVDTHLTAAEADALFLTPAEGNAAYVLKAGDTMTGALLFASGAKLATTAGTISLLLQGGGSGAIDLFLFETIGGFRVLTIDSSGEVGIGTSSPAYWLELAASAPDISLHYTGAAAAGNKGKVLFSHNRNSDGTQEVLGYIQGIAENNQSQGGMRFVARTGVGVDLEVMRIEGTGEVGIGTTTPGAVLDVRGTTGLLVGLLGGSRVIEILQTGTTYRIRAAGGAAADDFQIFQGNAGILTLHTNSLERVRVASDGKVGIGGTPDAFVTILQPGDNFGDGLRLTRGANEWDLVSAADFFIGYNAATVLHMTQAGALLALAGTEALPTYSFDADSDTGMRRVGANVLGFVVGAADLVEISATAMFPSDTAVTELGTTTKRWEILWTARWNDSIELLVGSLAPVNDGGLSLGLTDKRWSQVTGHVLGLTDTIGAPGAVAGVAFVYVDSADGDLKVKFGDGVTKTLATDT